jgi:hypothetical protein
MWRSGSIAPLRIAWLYAPSKKISADGSITSGAGDASGYSVIEADSLDAATDLAKGCPVLQGGASVSVFETFEVM